MRWISMAALLVMAGCDSDTDTDKSSSATGDCSGTLSADIDGTRWDATLEVCAVNESGILNITGSDSGGNQLGVTVNGPAVGTVTLDGMLNSGRWSEGMTTFLIIGTQGTLTFDTLDASGTTGTFSFDATDATGAGGTRVITNGVFDVDFN